LQVAEKSLDSHSGALRAAARKRAAPDARMESWEGMGSF
jgi:hypothetical protein